MWIFNETRKGQMRLKSLELDVNTKILQIDRKIDVILDRQIYNIYNRYIERQIYNIYNT